MPHKFNAARRHKFPKKRYRVTNWAEYTEILRRRGDLTIWVTDDTLKQWRAPRRTTPGGQPKYSNIAIETCLTLRTIYKLPLRQTQGLMRSIARLMGPPKNAVLALKSRDDPSLRDQHIAQIQTYGRLAWQVRSGYNQRSRAEAQIGRWKSVIGPKLRSRRFENQKTEAQIGVRALNRMTELGCARFESVG